MKLPRTQPVIGWPLLVAIGISIRMRPSGTSHCHPIHSSVNPCRISAPLPNSAAVDGIGGVRRILKDRQNPLGAAVAGFVEQPAVAARRIDRLQQIEVRREFDQTLRILRRQLQIDDAAVLRQGRIEREVHLAGELFVRAGGAERLAVEDDLAPIDLQPRDASRSAFAAPRRGWQISATVSCHGAGRLWPQ